MVKAKIEVGNAPCSWGTLEFAGMESERIEYEQMLDELVATGYRGTELGDWGFMPTDPAALQAELEKRHIAMWGAFVQVALHKPAAYEEGKSRVLQIARLIAAAHTTDRSSEPFLVLAYENGSDPERTDNAGRVTPELGLNDADWTAFANNAEDIARVVQGETGLRTVFHHHCAGYVETPAEIARLMDMTDPDLLGLVFDTGHYAFGAGPDGCEAVTDGLNHFGDRIWYVHFKDCEPEIARQSRVEQWDYFESVQHGVFCELGQGCVDFPAVLAWMRARGDLPQILVEQDVLPGMGSPKESAQRNRDYLKMIGV